MMRRDYILQMIEEFAEALKKIRVLRHKEQWNDAAVAADGEFQRLLGAGADEVVQWSDSEMFARLLKGEATHAVHAKLMMVVALLSEAGDLAVARGQVESGHLYYLKALNVLLDPPQRIEPGNSPDFVPRVDVLLESLRDFEFSLRTRTLLMRHYECTGQFSKAEDELFKILDSSSGDAGTLEFGITFYQRLQAHRDKDLKAGNLPRTEVDAGLEELVHRLDSISNKNL